MPLREINILDFQQSLKNELLAAKDRVRNLIGDAHRGEDGRHKEEVLKDILRRNLPKNLSVGTGFILKEIQSSSSANISPQIDIIIYDNSYPTLFNEGDFIITTDDHVKGIVEVKTKITNSNISDFCDKLNERCEFVNDGCFKGLFAYEYEGDINATTISSALKNSRGKINHLSLGENYFIKQRNNVEGESGRSRVSTDDRPYYNIYELSNLSFTYFVGNLVYNVVDHDLESRRKFLFPLDDGKEVHCVNSIHYDQNLIENNL